MTWRLVLMLLGGLLSAAPAPAATCGPPPEVPIAGRVWVVAPDGDDRAEGTAAAPFRTIGRAMAAPLSPGEGVLVRPGTYVEQVTLAANGAPGAEVILRADPPGAALRPPAGAYSTLMIRANHVAVEGFDIVGGDGHGIDGEGVHHVRVAGNRVHDSGGSGIQFNYSEFLLIERNETFGNAGTNGYQTSGISVYQARNVSGDTATPGFRVVIRGNLSHDNIEGEAIPGEHTDGNGIIVDDFQSTQTAGFPNYDFPTLVENNLVFGNGGKGIQVTWSDNVTVRNNTASGNNRDLRNPGTWRGELSNAQSSRNLWLNNIAVADPSSHPDNGAIDNTSYGGYVNAGVIWAGNLTFDGTEGSASVRLDGGNHAPRAGQGNLLGVDPVFRDPGRDFRLAEGSPALEAGVGDLGLGATDLAGGARVIGRVDIGAYEAGACE